MFGFELDIWDYLTFLALAVSVLGALTFLVWMAGLPGRIAIARKQRRVFRVPGANLIKSSARKWWSTPLGFELVSVRNAETKTKLVLEHYCNPPDGGAIKRH